MAHGGNEYNGVTSLVQSIRETLSAGLMPVIHGDAGLYGTYQRDGENDSDNFKNVSMSAGILGGDTLVDIIATHPLMDECISKTIFLTDVEGVFTKDPKTCKDAVLVRSINIDPVSGEVMTEVSASASLHEHDVTGGLEVSSV
jgi:isopentenyl phosphate kinase